MTIRGIAARPRRMVEVVGMVAFVGSGDQPAAALGSRVVPLALGWPRPPQGEASRWARPRHEQPAAAWGKGDSAPLSH
jgi:hypothetical protein